MVRTLLTGLAFSMALVATAPLATGAAAQGIQHTFLMRGQIVDASQDSLVVCIGRADGAEPGQVLDVIRISSDPGPRARTFRRTPVGQVRIEHIVDDHFAHAVLVSGQAERHDLVELRRTQRR
ncbi:MAG: hypothetical protein K2X31_05825 [Sphingopyxis sp.]|jgi:hypothetical protein|nr:hypothetical protein [Sphingopyxis sp.]